MTYYKVVRAVDDKLYSSFVEHPEVRTLYIPGEKTLPQLDETLLFVFDSLENAKYFLGHTITPSIQQIWKCQIERPVEPSQLWRGVRPHSTPGQVQSFWDRDPKEAPGFTYGGTIMCESVMLTKSMSVL